LARPVTKPGERPLVAVVGGDTLLAREILELLGDAKPAPRVQLISAAADAATMLSADEDEAVLMTPLAAESLEDTSVAFLAGSPASSRRTLKVNPPSGPVLIDLTGALEDQTNARLRAPSAEPEALSTNPRTTERRGSVGESCEGAAAPCALRSAPSATIHIIAHPGAIAVAMLLARLHNVAPIRRSLIHVFEPASERGQRGLDELQQQTVAVLSFKKLKTDVYDAQLAFNMLARYGEEAMEPLDGIEQRMERHLASLLAAYPAIPMPSLRMIQAPVFHGHSFSVWVEFEDNPGAYPLARALNEAGLDVRPDDPPSNAGIAGQSGISVGAIAADRNHPRACWLWMVADNFRLAAENALAVAKEVL
jgi:aspartate-semialdehyde dehydrogenase